mgnify:CR=1 FL=1
MASGDKIVGSPPEPVKETPDDSPREPRKSRLIKLVIHSDRLGSADAIARNFSDHGLGGKTQMAIKPGDKIVVEHAHLGRLEAEIRWVEDDYFGAAISGEEAVPTQKLDRIAHDRGDWEAKVIKPFDTNHFYTRYRPMISTYRPGFSNLPRKK